MTEQEKWQQAVAKAEGERVAYLWMKKHIRDFEPCEANSKLMGEWLTQNNLPLTEENLDKAAAAIGDRLARSPEYAASQAVSKTEQATDPEEEFRNELDASYPLPRSWVKIYTPKDIHDLSSDDYRRMFHSSAGENFRKRVFEINRFHGVQGRR